MADLARDVLPGSVARDLTIEVRNDCGPVLRVSLRFEVENAPKTGDATPSLDSMYFMGLISYARAEFGPVRSARACASFGSLRRPCTSSQTCSKAALTLLRSKPLQR